VAHELHTAVAKRRRALPGSVLAKKPERAHGWTRAQVAECGEPAKWMTAEQIAAVLALNMAPRQRAARGPTEESQRSKSAVTRAYHIARRADNACAMVTPSAYSRSPPTGSPRAMRVTVS